MQNDWQFSTKLNLNGQTLYQIKETNLLGVWIQDDLKWSKKTTEVVRNVYARMTILRKLNAFEVPVDDLINICILFIRPRFEQ